MNYNLAMPLCVADTTKWLDNDKAESIERSGGGRFKATRV